MFQLPRLGCEGPRFESTETATAIVAGVDSPVSHSCAPHYQNSPNRFGNARVCVVYVGRVVALSGALCYYARVYGVRGACSGTQSHSVALYVAL